MPVKGVIVIAVWWQKVFVLVQFQNHFRCWLWGQSLSTFSPSCSLSCQPPSGRVRAWFRTDATCTLSTASTPAPHPTAPLQQAGTRTLPSGAEGAVWEEAALGERLKGRLIRQQEGWVQGGEGSQCRQALGFIHFHLVFFFVCFICC